MFKKELFFLLLIIFFIPNLIVAQSEWFTTELDKSLISSTKNRFNMVNSQGKIVGEWIFNWEREQELLVISDTSILYNSVYETLIQKTDLNTLKTISATLDLSTSQAILKGEILYEDDVYKGAYNLERGDSVRTIPLDDQIKNADITRLETFALLSSIPLHKGLEKNLKVFSVSSNSLLDMKLSVLGDELVTVPSGIYDTFKIEMETSSLTNIVYVSKVNPHIVKVDVVGRDLTMELVYTTTL